ncbi:hypothetical protein NPIL_374271 [Nephila pilipes]|uniref:Uncharacterized protein n=1 Tax=Nephila pilipes TaxID=299642 RepID=A0A8X6U0C7_NEPPI|nr:hypothetical protein NPIL_374271 [Nephila pilipes]
MMDQNGQWTRKYNNAERQYKECLPKYSRTKYKTIDKGKSHFKKRRKILYQMKEKVNFKSSKTNRKRGRDRGSSGSLRITLPPYRLQNDGISSSYNITHRHSKPIKEPVRPGKCHNDISLPHVDDKKTKKKRKW